MNGSGRMNLRLASSCHEGDRRAVDRLRQATTTADPGLATVPSRPARSAVRTVRVALAAIRRLVPRFA